MATTFRLSDQAVVAFVGASDPERAMRFYRDTLGLTLLSEELPFALVFDCHGTPLRVTMVDRVAPAGYTVLGWQVPDITAAVNALHSAGVEFQRYPGMDQNALGVWKSPGGAKVAWFRDPDGNTLSVSQHGESMTTTDSVFQRALSKMLTEIFDGPPGREAYLLNPGDPGLLRQLETIDASTASTRPMSGKPSIAAHVDHVQFGLAMLNRWAAGEANPWAGADWNASWQRTIVTEDQWRALRDALRRDAEQWRTVVATRTSWDDVTAAGALSTAAHTAYHVGAIRQILAGLQPGRH